MRSVFKITALFSLAAAFVFTSIPRPAEASESSSAFCQPSIVRDYLKPLRQMSPIHHVPGSGRLPFAPKGISLYAIGNGLRVGKGVIGFVFRDKAIEQQRRVNWHIKSELFSVGHKGDVKALLATKNRNIVKQEFDEVNGQRFVVSATPSFYRVDVSIQTLAGRALGRYSEYFRVIRPTLDVRLSLSDQLVAPGETLFIRTENWGTLPVLPSSGVQIEQYDGVQWVKVSASQVGRIPLRFRSRLLGGNAGPCAEFAVPLAQSPGIYRVTNTVALRTPEDRRQVRLATEFHVSD